MNSKARAARSGVLRSPSRLGSSPIDPSNLRKYWSIGMEYYHMHTPLCGHAIGEPEEYVKQAIKVGLKEMGFSDHAPMVHKPMPGITMAYDELPKYHAMIEDVRNRYASQISIKIALESDFLPGYENKTKAI